jgi:two-component system sensor kinase FixL
MSENVAPASIGHGIPGSNDDYGLARRWPPARIPCHCRDITDEAAVRRQRHERTAPQSILDTVPDAMIVIDELGQILSFSAAAQRLFGYDEDEVVGRNVHCLMPSPDRERHDDYIRHYRNGGDRRIIGIGRTVTARRRDGTDFQSSCQ